MLARDVGAAGLPMADLLLADAKRAADLRLGQAGAAARLLNAFAERREARAEAGNHRLLFFWRWSGCGLVLLDLRLDRQFLLDNARAFAMQGRCCQFGARAHA